MPDNSTAAKTPEEQECITGSFEQRHAHGARAPAAVDDSVQFRMGTVNCPNPVLDSPVMRRIECMISPGTRLPHPGADTEHVERSQRSDKPHTCQERCTVSPVDRA